LQVLQFLHLTTDLQVRIDNSTESAAPPPSVPDPPTSLTATAISFTQTTISGLSIVQQHRQHAILDWDDYPGAVDYEIYRDNVFYGNSSFQEFGIGTRSIFTDKSVGTVSRDYAVRADDGLGSFTLFTNQTFGVINDITGFASNVSGTDVGLEWDAITTNDPDTPITSIQILRKPTAHISEDFESRLVGEEPEDNFIFYFDHASTGGAGTISCGDFHDGAGTKTGTVHCRNMIVDDDPALANFGSGEKFLVFNATTRRDSSFLM